LVQAEALIAPIGDPPEWSEPIEHARENPPRLPTDLLLSLGNQTSDDAKEEDLHEGS
jgi:hypothetical protein